MKNLSDILTVIAVAMSLTGAFLSITHTPFIFDPKNLVYLGILLAFVARFFLSKPSQAHKE